MKNPNQAKRKTAKPSSVAPAQKSQDHAPLPITPRRPSPLAVLAADPLAGRNSFEIDLDWIGDSMEPEVFQGNLARIWRRECMQPCLGELVLGLLKNGALVFGAFHVSDDDKFLRIDFINPTCPSVFYREADFQWLFPVECVSMMDETHKYRRIMKTIAFERGDDAEAAPGRTPPLALLTDRNMRAPLTEFAMNSIRALADEFNPKVTGECKAHGLPPAAA